MTTNETIRRAGSAERKKILEARRRRGENPPRYIVVPDSIDVLLSIKFTRKQLDDLSPKYPKNFPRRGE